MRAELNFWWLTRHLDIGQQSPKTIGTEVLFQVLLGLPRHEVGEDVRVLHVLENPAEPGTRVLPSVGPFRHDRTPRISTRFSSGTTMRNEAWIIGWPSSFAAQDQRQAVNLLSIKAPT